MISVLLPYRDAAATIEEAIASVAVDLGPDDEIVAIDDGSRDDSTAIVERMQDARIRLSVTGGVGIARALAVGVAAARGDLLARMDADDISLPGRLPAERELLERDPSLGAVAVQIDLFGVESEGMARYVAWQNALVSADDHARAIYVESPLCHPATMIRRSALEACGGFQDPPWPEDWDLWLRLHHAGFGLAKVPRLLFRWRRRPSNLTTTDPRCAPERLVAARARYLADALGDRAFAIWGAGHAGRSLSRALASHDRRARFFLDVDPKKIGRSMHDAPIIDAAEGMARARAESVFLVVCVATPGARDIVRARLAAFGEGRDYVCAS